MKERKKEYTRASVDVVRLDCPDIITASCGVSSDEVRENVPSGTWL